jgi:GAF domain-containing protein
MTDRQQGNDPFRWILDVGTAIVSSATAEEALMGVAAAIGEGMNVSTVDLQSYDPERDCITEEANWNRDGLTEQELAYLGKAMPLSDRPDFRRIIASRRIEELHVDDPDLPSEDRAVFARWGYKTTMDVALCVGSEVVGILGVTESRFVRRFMQMERERFEQLADLAAAAVRNTRLYRRERTQGRFLEALLDVARAMAESVDAEPTLDTGARVCGELLDASWAAVYVAPPTGAGAPALSVFFTGPEEWGDNVTGRGAPPAVSLEWPALEGVVAPAVFGSADLTGAVAVQDTRRDAPPDLHAEMAARSETCRLAVPLVYQGEALGVLAAGWREAAPGLGEGELEFVEAVGLQLATALASVSLEAGRHDG